MGFVLVSTLYFLRTMQVGNCMRGQHCCWVHQHCGCLGASGKVCPCSLSGATGVCMAVCCNGLGLPPGLPSTATAHQDVISLTTLPLTLTTQGGGGRRYFDSGEFAMVVREGKAPDDILVQDLYLSDVATLTPRWKCAPDVDRPKTHKPSRLSASSSA